MKLRLISAALMIACLPLLSHAQTKVADHGRKVKNTETGEKLKVKHAAPVWAGAQSYNNDRYVYFPDYYTFYDPNRGYVYWSNGTWVTSSSVPVYLNTIDLGKARIQVLNELDLGTNVYPERHYRTYYQMYPAQPVDIVVPVPDIK